MNFGASRPLEGKVMTHPLVGRTLVRMYETGVPGAGFEVAFISDKEKTSKDVTGVAKGYAATHTYDLAIVAPDGYMISRLEDRQWQYANSRSEFE